MTTAVDAKKLSIIIPVYRVEATLNRCLESVVNQSFSDFEVILVDDGSPDGCPQMCDEWTRRDSRFRVIHKANGGLSDARNAGIEQANGTFVTFIDSDDYIAPDTLQLLMPMAEETDLLEYPIWCHYGSSRQMLLSLPDRSYADAVDYWLQGKAYLHTYACNKIYRRKLFDSVRFPVGKVFEDAYTLPRLLKQHPRLTTTSQGLYYYCWNGDSITSKARGEQLAMLLEAHLHSDMPMDDEYYLRLLNIQMDVCELTGQPPVLNYRKVAIVGTLPSFKLKVKAITQNILGINGICKINRTVHRLCRW